MRTGQPTPFGHAQTYKPPAKWEPRASSPRKLPHELLQLGVGVAGVQHDCHVEVEAVAAATGGRQRVHDPVHAVAKHAATEQCEEDALGAALAAVACRVQGRSAQRGFVRGLQDEAGEGLPQRCGGAAVCDWARRAEHLEDTHAHVYDA